MVKINRKTLRFVLPIMVIGFAALSARLISANKPEPQIRDEQASIAAVDATRLKASRYPVLIRSRGTVQPTLANTLVPAVPGTVTSIDDDFVVGGRFSAGDVLLQIDPRDYDIALTQAQANLAQANAQLSEEQALAGQATAEWRSLGRSGEPSALTLRQPQLAAAKANSEAAVAQVLRAELDLERTRVVAPYDGIVTERLVDTGQFVGLGAPVGSIHSLHAVDVSLPLTNRQLTFLQLPNAAQAEIQGDILNRAADSDSANHSNKLVAQNYPAVELTASVGATQLLWKGLLIRAEGIDPTTQQLNVIVRVQQPYTQADRPLRVGQFVQAKIEGQVLEDVFVIPRSALREGREVLIVDANNLIQRRDVNVVWSDNERVVIDAGVQAGEVLVTTPLSTVANGTPVQASIDGAAPLGLES